MRKEQEGEEGDFCSTSHGRQTAFHYTVTFQHVSLQSRGGGGVAGWVHGPHIGQSLGFITAGGGSGLRDGMEVTG